MSAMASGKHAKYFEDAQNAFSPQGMAEGNGILASVRLEGPVARGRAQAAQATGLGQQTLQQMLPVIASMIMGGLFKQSTNQLNRGPGGGVRRPRAIRWRDHRADDAAGRANGGRHGHGRRPAAAEAGTAAAAGAIGDPFDNPFGKILKDMFGGGVPGMPGERATPQASSRRFSSTEPGPSSKEPSQNPFGDNPLGKIFEEMLKGAQGGRQRRQPGRSRSRAGARHAPSRLRGPGKKPL